MNTSKTQKPSAIERRIAAANAAFLKASPAQKRVLIAKDALARLRAGKYKATHGDWATIMGLSDATGEESLQLELAKPGLTCECCALGGLMLSTVALNNQCSVDDYWADGIHGSYAVGDKRKDKSRISRFFSVAQMRLIEYTFEDGNGATSLAGRARIVAEAFNYIYTSKSEDPDLLLRAILNNIVRHNGTFKPHKEPGIKKAIKELNEVSGYMW